MAEIDTASLGNQIIKKRLELEDELVLKQAIKLQQASIKPGEEIMELRDAVQEVRSKYGPQINYIVSLFVENETNKLKVLDEIIGESAKVNRLASIAQDFSQKIPKENLKELPIPDHSEKPKQASETSLDSFEEKLKSPKYNTDENLSPLMDSPDEETKKQAEEEFIRRNANKGSFSERTKRELDEALAEYDRVAEPGASGGATQTEQEAAKRYEQKLNEHEDAKKAEIKPSRAENKPGGFYEKGPHEPAPPAKEEKLGETNPDGTSNYFDPNTGGYSKTNPAETKKTNEDWLDKQGYIRDPRTGEYDPKLLRNAQWAQEDKAEREKEREERYKDRLQNQKEKNDKRVAAGKPPIDYSNSDSTSSGGDSKKQGEENKPKEKLGAKNADGTNNYIDPKTGQYVKDNPDKKFGVGEQNPFGLYGPNGKQYTKGLKGLSNRSIAAGAAKEIRNSPLIRNTAKGAGSLVAGAGTGLQSAGTGLGNLGQNLENSGKTADGGLKSGLGNAAKRFLGKDVAKTGERLGAAGDKLKEAGDKIKQQAVNAIARAVISAMPAIATALAFLLVFTMMMAILILVFCKAMENPAAEVVARFAGVPAEFKKICKDAGFSTAGCDSNTGSTGSGYDCKSNRIKAPGVDIADVRYVPDNKNLYYALIMMRSQEFNGLDENYIGGDADSCGPYQQRLQEIASGANGQLAVKAREIFGKPITSCSQLVKEGGNAFFDKLALERLKLKGAYDKISALNLQPGNGSVYLLAQQLCNTQRPDAYNVSARECPIDSYYVKRLGKNGEAFLADNQYDKRKAGCTGSGIPTDVPAKDSTTKPASITNPELFAENEYSLSKILGSITTEAQNASDANTTETKADSKSSNTKLDLDSIAKQTGVQSISVQELGTSGIQSYNGNTPPASPASSIKAVVADVVINEIKNGKLKLSDTITLTGKTALYNQETQKTVTVKEAMDAMLSRSSNDYTNLLVEKLGGPGDGINSKISSLGYSRTKFNEYLSPGGKASNVITSEEFSNAMNKIWQDPNAQSALSRNTDKYGIDSIGNKDAGNSLVTGNSAVVEVNGKKYIISTFYNGNGEAVNNVGPNDAKIRDATNGVIAQLKAGKTINPNSNSVPSSTGTSDCNGTTSGDAGNGTVNEDKIKEYAQKDCKGEIKLTVERRNACAFTATNILNIINPSLSAKIGSVDTWCMYNGFECPKQGGILNNGGKLVNSASEIQNYGLVFYARNPSGNKNDPTDSGGGLNIGHVGVVYKGSDGKLKEVSNYSTSCTHIHNSPEDAVAAYSGTYGGAVYIAIQ